MKAAFLIGERIYARPLLDEDIVSAAYLAWINDPQVRLHMSSGVFPTTRDNIKEFCRRKLDSHQDAFMAVVDKSNDQHIGNAGIVNIVWKDRVGEISSLVGDKEYWGAGYFSEIVDLLSSYAFDELNLNKILSIGSNPAVYTTLVQMGWSKEGILKQHHYVDGQYQDVVITAMFRDQYVTHNVRQQ